MRKRPLSFRKPSSKPSRWLCGTQATRSEPAWRFKDAYPKCLAVSGDIVFVSLGLDPEGRRAVVEEAVMNGAISESSALAILGPAEPPRQEQIAEGQPASVVDITKGMELVERLEKPEGESA